MIERYLNIMKEKLNGHDPLRGAKRYRYSYYNPQGEAYITMVVEYLNGEVCMHKYKFNCNMFVGEKVDYTMFKNPPKETIDEKLRKDAYTFGTGIRKYITV